MFVAKNGIYGDNVLKEAYCSPGVIVLHSKELEIELLA